ncbi:hypothetical protein CQA18_27340, partial [Enterobacter hormaechei]
MNVSNPAVPSCSIPLTAPTRSGHACRRRYRRCCINARRVSISCCSLSISIRWLNVSNPAVPSCSIPLTAPTRSGH